MHPSLRRASIFTGLAFLTVVSIDCGLILGAPDYKVGPCPAGTCACGGFAIDDQSCNSCVSSSCCAAGTDCRNDTDCAPLFDCLLGCAADDAACRNHCRTDHPAAQSQAVSALDACLSRTCGDTCLRCGGVSDWRADSCTDCVKTTGTCCSQAKACADDDVCAERERCYRACTYPSCPDDCDALIAASSGQTLAAIKGYSDCVRTSCPDKCAYGSEWGCVGQVSWPAPVAGAMVPFTVHVTEFFKTDSVVAGVKIRMCSAHDNDCSLSTTSATTDAKGLATLSVPSGFNGYFDATGQDSQGHDLMESLIYVSWPLTSATTFELPVGTFTLYSNLIHLNGGGDPDAGADPTLGGLFIYARDCLGDPAPRVKLTVDNYKGNEDFYFDEHGIPVAGRSYTSTDGRGGFANVATELITLRAKRSPDDKDLGQFTAYVRQQSLTFIALTPTPNN